MINHVVLLGDSIFDNGAYVEESSVIYEMRKLLNGVARVTLLAEDGAVVHDIQHQISKLPKSTSHIVVSVGGNDAILTGKQFWNKRVTNSRDAFVHVAKYISTFAAGYQDMFKSLSEFGVPITLCTIYDRVPGIANHERVGLSLFNDVITRYADQADIIDLRTCFTDPELFSPQSPIEPSDAGSVHLARLIGSKLGMWKDFLLS